MIPVSRRRLVVLGAILGALMLGLGGRAWFLQVASHSKYVACPARTGSGTSSSRRCAARYVDDTGQPMVEQSVGAGCRRRTWRRYRRRPTAARPSWPGLPKLLRISDKVMQERVRLCTVGVAQPCWQGSPYQPIPVAQNVTETVALQVLENKS